MPIKFIGCLAFALALQGCAFTDANLDIGLPADGNLTGPLSSVEEASFSIGEIVDLRTDQARIGYKKNGYGANTADVLSNQPVTEVVSQALTETLQANGQAMEDGGYTIAGGLKTFWFELDINFWTVEFIGNTVLALTVTDSDGQTVYENEYSGSYADKKGGGGNKTMADVMSRALQALMEDFAFDESLVEALEDS